MADAGTLLVLTLGLTVQGCVADLCPNAELDDVLATVQLPELPLVELLERDALLEASLPGPATVLVSATDPAAPTTRLRPDDAPAPTEPSIAAAPSVHATSRSPSPTELSTHAVASEAPVASGRAVGSSTPPAAAGALVALAGVALYHRLDRERLLAHPARQRILEILARSPGMGTVAIAEELGCAYRTARHHLEMLLAFDVVVLHVKGNRRLWTLPADSGIVAEDLRSLDRHMVRVVRERPGTHLSEMARELGHAKTTLKFRIDRLVERGILREEQTGPLRRFYPSRPRKR